MEILIINDKKYIFPTYIITTRYSMLNKTAENLGLSWGHPSELVLQSDHGPVTNP